jgi:Ca-activated chloride channel family protein
MTTIRPLVFFVLAFAVLFSGCQPPEDLSLQTQGVKKRPAKSRLTDPQRRLFLQKAGESIPKADEDKTLSPYFFVLSDDPGLDRLPLKSTGAEVHVAGTIARVQVTQVYQNEGDSVLEAIYIFPLSTRAAIYRMRMTVGERVIEAKIKKRQEAREEYEQARKEGRTASLLEQQRPNVFQMNVANILPGDEIKVEIQYTELLIPADRTYEFVYPAVVGPRYSETRKEGAPATERWVENPYTHQGREPTYTFSLGATIHSGIPISKVSSPSHEVVVEYDGEKTAHVGLKDAQTGGNRDFVLRYRLAGGQIESGLLLYPGRFIGRDQNGPGSGEEENFFLLMMEPPERIEQKDIVPREYIFILDVSGSMYGFPLDITKQLMRDLLSHLRRIDHFNILLFSGGSAVLSERSLPATNSNIDMGIDFVTRQHGGGGTQLLPAMKRALALPREEGTSRIVVVATDGYISVEKETFELIRKSLGEANLFAFGIGSGVNRFLIEGMARAGMGEPFVILKPDAAKQQAEKFRQYVSSPLMQGISVSFDGFDAYDVEPQAMPDLFAERPVVLFGKYRGQPQGKIIVSGHVPGEKLHGQIPLAEANISSDNSALRYLWARHKILRLADMNKLVGQDDARVKEVTDLGLRYNLMTEFTSFVAVDTKVRADGTKSQTVRQPLPLPQGVSDYAIGASGGRRCKKRSIRGGYGMGAPADAPVVAAEPAPPPSKMEEKKVPTRLSNAEIVRVMRSQMGRLNACYQKHMKSTSRVSLKMVVEFTVGKDGRVTAVQIAKRSSNHPELEKCLLRILKRIRFPAGGSAMTFKFPLVLRSGG